jgi:hypothetical protein
MTAITTITTRTRITPIMKRTTLTTSLQITRTNL